MQAKGVTRVWLERPTPGYSLGPLTEHRNDALYSTVKVERGRKAFVRYASYPALKVPLSRGVEEIYLFNCGDQDTLYTLLQDVAGDFTATVHDYDLAVLSQERLSATGGSLLVDLDVRQGGHVALTRTVQEPCPLHREPRQ